MKTNELKKLLRQQRKLDPNSEFVKAAEKELFRRKITAEVLAEERAKTKINYVVAGDLMDVLNVKRDTICKWAREGKIPSIILPSGRRIFDQEKVVASLRKSGPNEGQKKDK